MSDIKVYIESSDTCWQWCFEAEHTCGMSLDVGRVRVSCGRGLVGRGSHLVKHPCPISTTLTTISSILLDLSESRFRRYLTCLDVWCDVAVSVEARTVEDEQPFASTRQWVTLGLALLLGLCTSAWYAPPPTPTYPRQPIDPHTPIVWRTVKERGPEIRLGVVGFAWCWGV